MGGGGGGAGGGGGGGGGGGPPPPRAVYSARPDGPPTLPAVGRAERSAFPARTWRRPRPVPEPPLALPRAVSACRFLPFWLMAACALVPGGHSPPWPTPSLVGYPIPTPLMRSLSEWPSPAN